MVVVVVVFIQGKCVFLKIGYTALVTTAYLTMSVHIKVRIR